MPNYSGIIEEMENVISRIEDLNDHIEAHEEEIRKDPLLDTPLSRKQLEALNNTRNRSIDYLKGLTKDLEFFSNIH